MSLILYYNVYYLFYYIYMLMKQISGYKINMHKILGQGTFGILYVGTND
jgi:hypothetical protein